MKYKVFYKIKSLVSAADKKLPSIDVVSFDVFDTLLVRRVHDPDLVKIPVARYISNIALSFGVIMEWQQVQETRDGLEEIMRAETGRCHDDHEAHYPTLMKQVLQKILGKNYDESHLILVTNYEIKIENAMLVPRAEIVAWLKEISSQGKKVLAISDMYLPSDHIQRLLDHAGLMEFVDQVFSSADSFLAKASGKAYQHIQQVLDLQPVKWMHVGDNPISDGLRASEHGIHAFVLQDPDESHRRAVAARYYFYSRNRAYWRGRATQQLMAPLEAENVERPPMYQEGYNFLGPLLNIFVQSVAEECKHRNISKVFFLSREGWMFKQIWERITPFLYPEGGLPATEYLYVSRLSLAGLLARNKV